MNKRIYFNDKFILIGQNLLNTDSNLLKINLTLDNLSQLNATLGLFLNDRNSQNLIIESDNLNFVLDELKKYFNFIEAAGGFIQKDNAYLFIKRLGKWDLPKGKLDKGETPEMAAIRECEEECDVHELFIKNSLETTYHIYPYKKSFALKATYWYYMTTNYKETLKPQIEEDIEEVRWLTESDIETIVKANTYAAIRDTINAFFKH